MPAKTPKQQRAFKWKLAKGNMTPLARFVAEKALGKSLPPGAEVHHIDCDETNDDPSNLVVCPSRPYHWLLHKRQRALDACGHADWQLCVYCKQYDDIANLRIHQKRPASNTYMHYKGQC